MYRGDGWWARVSRAEWAWWAERRRGGRQREGSGRSVGAQRWSEERRMQSKSVGRVCRVVQGGMERRWYELRGGSSGCCKDTERATGTDTCESLRQESSADGRRASSRRSDHARLRALLKRSECSAAHHHVTHLQTRPGGKMRAVCCSARVHAQQQRGESCRRGKAWSAAMLAWKAKLSLSLSPASQSSRQR
jgi:hypothetical protein